MLTAGPLTVKHIEENGHESIMQAISISFDPSTDVMGPSLTAYGVPLRPGETDEGGCAHYAGGVVYVMNEAGSTVGRYVLGVNSPVQMVKAA